MLLKLSTSFLNTELSTLSHDLEMPFLKNLSLLGLSINPCFSSNSCNCLKFVWCKISFKSIIGLIFKKSNNLNKTFQDFLIDLHI